MRKKCNLRYVGCTERIQIKKQRMQGDSNILSRIFPIKKIAKKIKYANNRFEFFCNGMSAKCLF